MKTKFHNSHGFTLIEMLVSIAVFTIIGAGIIMLFGSVFTSGGRLSILGANTDQARKNMFRFMQEIRNSATANTGAYPLAEASSQQITFYSNVDGGSDVERVRYYISNNKLYRGIVKPTGTPYTYNIANETSTLLQSDIANGANPLFYYYDGNYTGTGSSLADPINLNSVKLVKMDLKLYNKAGKKQTNIYTISGSGSIRSLKTNLGE